LFPFTVNAANAVSELIRRGADTKWRDSSGEAPLHEAAYSDSVDALKVLLNLGAEVRKPSKVG